MGIVTDTKEKMRQQIGDRLRQLRLDRNYTQEYVGKLANISKQTLYKYEKCIVTNIPSDKIEALAEVYGVTPEYIMGWENTYLGDLLKRGQEAHDKNTEEITAAVRLITDGTYLDNGKVCTVPDADVQAIRRHINLIIEDMKKQGITEKHITANAEEEAK